MSPVAAAFVLLESRRLRDAWRCLLGGSTRVLRSHATRNDTLAAGMDLHRRLTLARQAHARKEPSTSTSLMGSGSSTRRTTPRSANGPRHLARLPRIGWRRLL